MPGDPYRDAKELIRRCLAGEPFGNTPGVASPWEEFVRRYTPFLKRCLVSIASRRNIPLPPEDLEDLVSKIWEDLLRDDRRLLRRYPDGAPLEQWLLAVAVNRLLPAARKQAGERERLEAFKQVLAASLSEPVQPEEIAQRHEIEDRIQAALHRLPPREQFALSAFYRFGWTHREIASLLQLPLYQIGSLLRTARKHLRAVLGRGERLFLL